MQNLVEQSLSCPYCGEIIDLLIDASVDNQQYIEDCQVCCRPIVVTADVSSDDVVSVYLATEND